MEPDKSQVPLEIPSDVSEAWVQKFRELEYVTLRSEIEVAKSNMNKLTVGGAAIVPTAQSLANTYEIGEITLALPLIVVVLVLLFLTENHAVMRAGTYILKRIEPAVGQNGGWETWLAIGSRKSRRRTVDKLLVISFSVLASCYFVVSVILAVKFAIKEYGPTGQLMVGLIYLAVGSAVSIILYSQARTDTEMADGID